jgi:hypothetical protein
MAGKGRVDLTGRVHGAERKGALGATAQQLATWAREAEREDKHAGEETGANKSAPMGRERESERASGRESCRSQVDPTCQAAWARGLAGPSWASWAAFPFSFSLNFLIPFLFIFYRVFNSKFKLGFKFK